MMYTDMYDCMYILLLRVNPQDIVVNMLDCAFKVSEFKLQLHHYFHF